MFLGSLQLLGLELSCLSTPSDMDESGPQIHVRAGHVPDVLRKLVS